MNRVLIVELPPSYVGDKIAEMRDYIIESIDKGVLVLKHGTTTHIEELPELGAVEVCTREPEAPTAPEMHTVALCAMQDAPDAAPDTSSPEEAPAPPALLKSSALPAAAKEKASTTPPRGRLSTMTPYEVAQSYQNAAHPKQQIKILAELNSCSEDYIRFILAGEGIEAPKRGGRPRKETSE